MRVNPSTKHAKRMYRMLTKELQGPLDLNRPYLKVILHAARKAFNVKIHVVQSIHNGKTDGLWSSNQRLIQLRNVSDGLHKFSTLCHELAHTYCYDRKIFKKYHHDEDHNDERASGDHPAELYVENIGEMLFKMFFPNAQYVRAYFPKTKKEVKQ